MRGRLFKNKSLAEYTSWRVGGPAETLYIPSDINDLVTFLQQLPEDEPLLWLGLGSNVLIRDGGVEGVVIVTQGGLNSIAQIEAETIRAEAGVACAQLARYTARLGLTGIEFMAGIPGTVGGALAMNAGCWGGETWQTVMQVETINRSGQRTLRQPTDYKVAYRHVMGPQDEWFVAGYFKLVPGEKTRSLADIHNLLKKRTASQPTGLPNCGSVFRNPTLDYAARLIEQCGLKGMKIGDAIISEKHANFIINQGKATAEDIEKLISRIIEHVFESHGVRLMPEVCIIGK
ncbi:MAG: murB [Gammaproteobacteria bacterium]|nr:murB [Gammaproteobacteria bacterium]